MTRHRHDGIRKICRCSRRQWPKCGHSYHFAFFHRNRPHRYSLSRLLGRPVTTYQDARAEADRLRAAIRAGTFPPGPTTPVPEPTAETLETFGALWFERAVAQTKRSASSDAVLVQVPETVDKYPSQISGGQQQRVAIARALVNDPKLIVGDEPTGNLDTISAGLVFELFEELVRRGKTIVMVTHDRDLAGRIPRVEEVRDGRIVSAGEVDARLVTGN